MDDRLELEELKRLDELESRASVPQAVEQAPIKEQPKQPEVSMSKAALEGFKQAGSLGFADELGGLIDVALSKTGNLFLPRGSSNPYESIPVGEVYNTGKQNSRDEFSAAVQSHPGAVLAGGIAGSATAPVGGLLRSAITGGIAGIGGSESSDVPGMIKDALTGAALGGIGSKIAEVPGMMAEGIKKVGEFSQKIPDIASFVLGGVHGYGAKKALDIAPKVIDQASEILNKAPAQYRQALSTAAQSGTRNLAITHYLLSQKDPNYADSMKQK